MFWPPISSATRSTRRCALPHLIAPRGAQRSAPAPLHAARVMTSCHPPSPSCGGSANRCVPGGQWLCRSCLLLKAARTASISLRAFLLSCTAAQCHARGRLRQGETPSGGGATPGTGAHRGPRRVGHGSQDVDAQQMACAARHGRPSRCHGGRLWRDGILGCQAQRCSVIAQPGGATLHPLSRHTGMRVRVPLQPRLVVPVASVPCGGCAPPRPPQVAALRCWSSGLLLWAVCRTTGERLPPRPLPVAAAFFFLLRHCLQSRRAGLCQGGDPWRAMGRALAPRP